MNLSQLRRAVWLRRLSAASQSRFTLLKTTCACRKSNPNILVVQPAQDRAAKNGPGQLDGARGPALVKALPSDRTDQPFDISVLPSGARRCRPVTNAH